MYWDARILLIVGMANDSTYIRLDDDGKLPMSACWRQHVSDIKHDLNLLQGLRTRFLYRRAGLEATTVHLIVGMHPSGSESARCSSLAMVG